MSHLPRLIKILNVVSKYGLDEFAKDLPGLRWARFLLLPYSALWTLSKHRRGDKNERLRLALEELGPIYIKFGQLLSTRRDFLDPGLADELQSLQDNVPPFETPSIETIINQALGQSSDEIFSELDTHAFASASVAQVHKATLPNQEEVIVKVLRPGIEKTVSEDIALLKWLARQVESKSQLGKRLRPVEVVDDYEKTIFDELNFQAEAANTSQLRRNFENSEMLYVPKIYWDYTRENLLVMERIHGIRVGDINSLNEHGINLKKLAETGVEIFFTQVFEHNFFHADMHPGNIFVDRNKKENPQYIAIDCAIIGSLTKDDQEYLARNLLAIFKQDYRKVAELHVACGWVPGDTKIHEFESAIRSVCEPIFEKPLKEISFAQLLIQLFRTAGRFNMEVQPSLVLLQKTLLNVEGLGRQLYPELDLWTTALPYLENWNRKRLNPFTLLSRVQENIPEWIEQLPQLPELIIQAMGQSAQLGEINSQLQQQFQLQQRQSELRIARQQRQSRNVGIASLLLAAGFLIPEVSASMANIPFSSTVLGLLGVYLLCFRR